MASEALFSGTKIGKWFKKTFQPNKVKEEEAQKKFDQARAMEMVMLLNRQKEYRKANKAIKKLFDEWPELADNQPFIDELEKGLEASGQTLKDIVGEIRTEGGTYLDQLKTSLGKTTEKLTRSEAEARQGLESGLKIRRSLSKTLPGRQAIEDQLRETTTGALTNIKKYGGGRGLSTLADIYKQEMDQRRNLGIAEANYKTQMGLGLADAEAQAGTTMADIIARNAATTANMSSTLYGAQSNWLNQLATAQTNVAGQQERTAGTMYDVNTQNQMNQYIYNQLAPHQAQLTWEQSKAMDKDPFSAQLQFLGEQAGFARADMAQAIAQRNRNMNALGGVIKGAAPFLKLIPGAGPFLSAGASALGSGLSS